MKRRDFFKSTAAAAAGTLPAVALAATVSTALPNGRVPDKVTRLRVGSWRTARVREANRVAREAGLPPPGDDPADSRFNYWAEAIKRGGAHFYRIGDTSVAITPQEYRMVVAMPNISYLSVATKLHFRVHRAREGKPNVLWIRGEDSPIDPLNGLPVEEDYRS